MLNFRTNLRIVVAVVACLAVTTMFASCDKDGDGGDDGGGTPSGKIDPKLVGSLGWFDGGGNSGRRVANVYTFYQDGTFTLYKAVSLYSISSSGGRSYTNAWETFFKGKYAVNGKQIVFSNTVVLSVTVGVNGDANGIWQNVGTRERANIMQSKFPANGYKSYTLDSEEYIVFDDNSIGIGIDEGYGSDGYYHYEKNWVR